MKNFFEKKKQIFSVCACRLPIVRQKRKVFVLLLPQKKKNL